LLPHNAVRPPGRQRVVESFVSRAYSLLARVSHARVVKAGQITHSIVGGRWHYPRITAIGKDVSEAAVILEDVGWVCAQRGIGCSPVNRRVGKANVEISYHRLAVDGHISRRGEVGFFDVLQVVDQRLLRRTTRAGIPLNRSLIDHDRKRESRIALRRRHHVLRSLVDAIARPVPIDNRAIDATADHVINLTLDLRRVRLAVTNIHVVRLTEPENHVSVNLGRGSRVKQGVNVNLTYISRASIVICLGREGVCGAGVVRSLSRKSCGGYHVRGTGRTQSRRCQHCDCNYQSKTH
jgi:hypothetical protein